MENFLLSPSLLIHNFSIHLSPKFHPSSTTVIYFFSDKISQYFNMKNCISTCTKDFPFVNWILKKLKIHEARFL
jgi:hypothetical protein